MNTPAIISLPAGPRARRSPLTDEEKLTLKRLLLARQTQIAKGIPPSHTISQLSALLQTTDATVNKYKAEWGLTRGQMGGVA